jgi:hypothetical protein
MSRTTARTHPGRLAASILLLVCITGPVAGCGSGDNSVGSLAGPGLAFGTGGTAGSIVPALVGSWFRLAYLPDSAGSVRTLESTLAFNADGTLTRTLVTRTLSFGFAEQSVSSGTWRATATTVTINVTATNVGGSGGSVPVDSTQTGVGFPGAMTPNPPFGPVTRSGGTTTTTIPDSLGTSTGSTTYTYRIETSSTGSTLFLNDTPFVRLNTGAQ